MVSKVINAESGKYRTLSVSNKSIEFLVMFQEKQVIQMWYCLVGDDHFSVRICVCVGGGRKVKFVSGILSF